MKQILFVLKEDQIAFWEISRGSLVRRTLNGNRWNDFTSSYWDEWSEANQAGDLVDAILLSDKPNGFGALPEWLQGGTDPSAWTVELLSKMSKDAEFSAKGLVLSQGETNFTLAQGDTVETYSLLLSSSPCRKMSPRKRSSSPSPQSRLQNRRHQVLLATATTIPKH